MTITVFVPEHAVEDVIAAAAAMRQNPRLTVGPLVSRVTKRFVSLRRRPR